jgi:prefoldin subunit 5
MMDAETVRAIDRLESDFQAAMGDLKAEIDDLKSEIETLERRLADAEFEARSANARTMVYK